MRKLYILGFFLFLSSAILAQDIAGFWQTIDKSTKKPSSVIAIYPYQGKYYGRIIASYDDNGVIDDSIYHPKGRAPGISGHPYYSGLDFVWDAIYEGSGRYTGYVVDPRNGNTYNAVLWTKNGNLILRGELLIFGSNEVWPPFPEDGFNDKFKKPDLTTFVPVIPESVD